MINIFVLTLLITMGIIMFLALPIAASIYIYKYTKKHPELGSAMSLALIALFVPFFLGIVYFLYHLDQVQTEIYDKEHP